LRVFRLIRRGFGASLLLALAACATSDVASRQEAQLFGEVYADVVHYHMTATTPERLSLAALGGIARFDPAFTVAEAKGEVVLSDGSDVARQAAPPAGDAAAWGVLTARMLSKARERSPMFAGIAPDIADERVIDTALRTLDRFSRYVRPDIAREHRAERDGFVGVGVRLAFDGGKVRVAAVMPETPASEAGVQAADRVIAIDGTALASLTEKAVQQRLDGPKDSPVALEIARAGCDGHLNFVMRRELIFRPTVTLETHDGIAWLRVEGFNQRTGRSAARLLRQAHQELGPAFRGIVLDLRGNPGGLLDQAVDLASIFLDGVPVSTTVGRVPESHQSFDAPLEGAAERAPLVVLIDGATASSSEIVAAALQDEGRAVVVGSASFGKGTVQTVLRTANGGELTVTWAELFAPKGYALNHHGVVPTVCAAEPNLPASKLRPPREQLDESGWERLRALCPAANETGDDEDKLAESLLADPARYAAALMPAATHPAEARLPR
jgi:carboxyl-terminal processing protease